MPEVTSNYVEVLVLSKYFENSSNYSVRQLHFNKTKQNIFMYRHAKCNARLWHGACLNILSVRLTVASKAVLTACAVL